MIEPIQLGLLFAVGGVAFADGLLRACQWRGPRLSAAIINAAYMTSGLSVWAAPWLPRETWPGLLSVLLVAAGAVWVVTRRRGAG